MIYCVIPGALAPRLEGYLKRHYQGDPEVCVLVERRGGERRRKPDRRIDSAPAGVAEERRHIHNADGRRIGERRGILVSCEGPEVPRKAKRFAEYIQFYERIAPSEQYVEDLELGRLVTRIQAGDKAAFQQLYVGWFDRVFTYLRLALDNQHEAEDAAQDVFVQLMGSIADFEFRGAPFRAWMFRIARNHSLNLLKRSNRFDIEDLETIERRRGNGSYNMRSLNWISDGELMMLIERLPLAQRQVVMLRYMMDLSSSEVAEILDRSPEAVRQLHHRAMLFLQRRLSSLSRSGSTYSRQAGRQPMRRIMRQATVLRQRRFTLVS